jgi:hypothetical protein
MKKILISIFIYVVFNSTALPQSVKYIYPDSGYQGTNFPVTIIGEATEWLVSSYFQIFFDSTGVTATFSNLINDTTITGTVYISGKAVTIPRTIYVLDRFTNVYFKENALRVLLSIPSMPVLILPPKNSINQLQNVSLLWDSNAYAISFRVQISADSTFITNVVDTTVSNTPLQLHSNILELGMKYYWRVNATNILGTSDWSIFSNFTVRTTGIQQISSFIPSEYKLLNNFPNPFNPTTKIRFQIPKTSFVDIKVYDITGRVIEDLISQNLKAGIYEYGFDGSGLTSGIYFVKMQTTDYSGVKRIVLVK